jgi:hypothetical protein
MFSISCSGRTQGRQKVKKVPLGIHYASTLQAAAAAASRAILEQHRCMRMLPPG